MSHGLDTLAALRRSGHRPKRVNVTAMDGHSRLSANVAEMNGYSGDLSWTVIVTPSDSIPRLDLRPLHGLMVEVDGQDGDRVEALAEACKSAGASRVIASVFRFDQLGTCHLVSQSDTLEVLVYAELAA